MDDESKSNRPPSMKNVDRLKAAINTICEKRLFPGAREVADAATDIAANTYLMYLEGSKPEVSKDFWLEVSMKRGKTPITKLVNYVIDETPPELRRIVQEAQNQITSAVSILERDFKPVRFPTLPEVLAAMDRISENKGLTELHRLWMSYLSSRTEKQRRNDRDLMDIGKRTLREHEAQKRGLTIEELAAEEEQQRLADERLDEENRWNEYVSGGTVVIDRKPSGQHVIITPIDPGEAPTDEAMPSNVVPIPVIRGNVPAANIMSDDPSKLPAIAAGSGGGMVCELVGEAEESELKDAFSWLQIRAIYVEHHGRLVKLSDADRDRVRACMTKH